MLQIDFLTVDFFGEPYSQNPVCMCSLFNLIEGRNV